MTEEDFDAAAFEWHLSLYHRLKPEDVEVTDVPGYWRMVIPCAGRPECGQPIHLAMFNEDPMKHTVYYLDHDRDGSGRFLSPYRTWRALWERREAK